MKICKQFKIFEGVIFFVYLFVCFYGHINVQHIEVPRLGVESELQSAGLRHSHGNARSKLSLQPTTQLMAMLDP